MQDRPQVVLIIVDWVAGTIELIRSDKTSHIVPLPQRPSRTEPLKRVFWSPTFAAAIVETTDGQQLAVELPTADNGDPIAARRVVYLDQNHWSTLSRSLHTPSRVPQTELTAARHLVRLVESRQVLLPLSAGHLTETGKWTNTAERKQLALTMLQLSRGWQMRDPLLVRRAELRHALSLRSGGSDLVQVRDVFTLEPNAVYGESLPMEPLPASMPRPWAVAMRSLLHLTVMVSTMLDDDSTAMGPADGWVETMQGYTDWLGSESHAPGLRRPRTNIFFLADLTTELAAAAGEAAITPEQLSEWVRTRSDAAITTMPALGLYREALREKLLDPATRWESNDLQDLMHLTVAAGYADAVVGDKSTIGTLRGAKHRHGCHANLYRTLSQMVRGVE